MNLHSNQQQYVKGDRFHNSSVFPSGCEDEMMPYKISDGSNS